MRSKWDRFWEKVQAGDGCWEWTGATQGGGYGILRHKGRNLAAHRMILSWFAGRELGRWEFACHRCDNPPCVRPDHLFIGDPLSNMRDRDRKGRGAVGERSGIARLKETEVMDIFFRVWIGPPGMSRLLCGEYGVSQGTVSNIKNGISWRGTTGAIT